MNWFQFLDATSAVLFWVGAFILVLAVLVNGLCIQLPCLLIYNNTAHELIAKRRTMTENELLFECVVLKGECPDCHSAKLSIHGTVRYCTVCHSAFSLDSFHVMRVIIASGVLQTGTVVDAKDRFKHPGANPMRKG